ncbi:hypothetical protein EDD17DRAFT_351201 [Pisolithus thermaeus]|nr:hypothetical protein EV401DRAFT_621387 [Pisolithus croceorrhizus]KAI6164493.1 hypothetical protein EDD17DRAFT_351201 [Pisolithus thermaeus]
MNGMPVVVPFQSVYTEAILPSGMKGEFVEELFNILCREGVYQVDEGTWNLKPREMLSPNAIESDPEEKDVAALLETIVRLVDAIPGGPDWHLDAWALKPRKWVAHGLQLIDKRRSPDVVLLGDTGTSMPTIWSDVVAAGKFKYQDAGRSVKQARKQLVDTASFALSSQINRQSFVGFSLCNPTLRVSVYTRDCNFELEPIDIHKEPVAFLRFIMVLTMVDPAG